VRQVGAKVPTFITEDLVAYCKGHYEGMLRADGDIGVVILAFLHYITHSEDSFQSIEVQFGLAHTNFHHDYYHLLNGLKDWAMEKFPMGSLAKRQNLVSKYVKFPRFHHTTALCDFKVFFHQKVQEVKKGHKWWWGPR